MKLWRPQSFYHQPWFWTLAIVLGQYYGVWWQSLGHPEPVYHPPKFLVARADPFNVTIVAPGLNPRHDLLRAR